MYFYSIQSNYTLRPNSFFISFNLPIIKDLVLLKLKADIDSSIASYHSGQQNFSFDITWSDFPTVPDRFIGGFSIITSTGALYLFFVPLGVFIVFYMKISHEKSLSLRSGLSVMGLSHLSYWLSWSISGIVFSILTSCMIQMMGIVCGFQLFKKCPGIIIVLVFFLLSIAMVHFAMLLSLFTKGKRAANSLAFAFILFSIVIQRVFASGNTLQFVFYNTEEKWYLQLILYLMYLYAPFNFAKIFCDLTHVSSTYFQEQGTKWRDGRDYQWSDLISVREGSYAFGGGYRTPWPLWSIILLIFNSLLYIGLLWYFDNLISGNQGAGKAWCFCFKKKVNLKLKPRKKSRKLSQLQEEDQILNHCSPAFERQQIKLREQSGQYPTGVRVKSISKQFKSFQCCSKPEAVQALSNVSLQISENQLLCILGHNGAGKTTLINIITGLISPSNGTIHFNGGLTLEDNLRQVQQFIGILPQFDLLWEELTAKQHIEIFASLKGINLKLVPNLVNSHLQLVGLQDMSNLQVKGFSGGMKRRLSLTLCGVGNPRLIIMDEPTTGMDPINRKKAWEFIKTLRMNRAILLTTHCMSQADALSDRIAIVKRGRLQCIGTSLALKNQYGSGYTVELFAKKQEYCAQIIELIGKISPNQVSYDLFYQNAGSLVFNIPDNGNILGFFDLMTGFNQKCNNNSATVDQSQEEELKQRQEEQQDMKYQYEKNIFKQIKKLISDVSISHTTLQEVFMKLTIDNGKQA